MSYDEQPDGDLHGECAAEIHRLEAEIERLRAALLAHAGDYDEQKRQADFYSRRCNALQKWQSRMRDPERTVVCDILANGNTLPPEIAGNRYAAQADRDAPVELPEPKEVPMPSPDGWLAFRTLDGTKWIGIHEPTTFDNRDPLIRASRVRQYGDASEAAGYARGRAEQQAVIDRLMLEHCPDEMTAEQRQTWAAAQAEKGGE